MTAAGAYRRLLPRFTRLLKLQQAVFTGVWLGLLDREALHAVDERYYDENRIYHGDRHNLGGLNDWERAAIDAHFGGCRSILVGAAGGGREVIALRKLGFDTDGFECHAGLVETANRLLDEEGLGSSVVPAPRDECPRLGRRYDGAIVGWGGYMLIQTRDRRVEFLRALAEQVAPGGPILVSFFHRPTGSRYFSLVAAVGNVLRRVRRRERIEVGDTLEPNFVHWFTREELESELVAAGLEPVFFSTSGYGHAVARNRDVPQEDEL